MAASAVALVVAPATAGAGGALVAFSVVAGSGPYAGDHELLATISPEGDGSRDRALIRFRLDRAATVTVSVAAVGPGARVVFRRTLRRGRGAHLVPWAPRRPEPRTYVVRFVVRDASGVRRFGFTRPARTPVIRVIGVEAAFARESYVPGEVAQLELVADEPSLVVEVHRAGADSRAVSADAAMNGDAVTEPVRVAWRERRGRPGRFRLRVGEWETGLYYAKVIGASGRIGYAPFVVRPRRLGQHRVAVVLPTYTWQAYNFRDDDGDGYGDTWYAGRTRETKLARPYADGRGIPPRFRSYDLAFLVWLGRGTREGKERGVDFLADSDLDAQRGATLATLYDLIVFPGHHEYVTTAEHDAVTGFRNRGGNLIFLSANNFFWRVTVRGRTVTRVALWKDLRRPEAALTGVGYVAGNRGEGQAPYVVRNAARAAWLFEGTGLVTGSRFGRFGVEIDATSSDSPPGTIVLAEIPNVLGPGRTAQMTYYETAKGARVFAAGAFTLAGRATEEPVTRLLDNLWERLARP